MDNTTRKHIQQKVDHLNKFGLDYAVEYVAGSPRITSNQGSRDVSPRLSRPALAMWLDGYITSLTEMQNMALRKAHESTKRPTQTPNTALREWLEQCGMLSVIPVEVKIGTEYWNGAIYTKPDSPVRALYLIGDLPKSYQRSARTVFPERDGTGEWYVTCYMQRDMLLEENKKYHPFDQNFIISRWPNAEKIDAHEPKPYNRKSTLAFNYLGAVPEGVL